MSPGLGLGLGLGLTRAKGGGVAFTPASLFASGDKGGMFDPAKSALYQDTAGTTPITASGQTVQRVQLIYPGGGTGGDLLEATNAPLYMEDSDGVKFIRFDGVNDFLKALAFDLSGCTKATLWAAVRTYTSVTSARVIAEHGVNGLGAGFCLFLGNTAPNGNIGAGVASSGAAYVANNSFAAPPSVLRLATVVYEPAAGTADDRARIRIDGADVDETQAASAGTPTTAAFASRDLYLGARIGTSIFGRFDLYAFGIIGRELTAGEMANLEASVLASITPPVPYHARPVAFTDSLAAIQGTTNLKGSVFSQAIYDTAAETVDVTAFCDLSGTFSYLAQIGVYVNGVFNQKIDYTTGSVTETKRITLPAGQKTVAFVNGPQAGSTAAAMTGTHLLYVKGNKPLTQVFPSATEKLTIYGDSIAVGDKSTAAHQNAWAMQARFAAYPEIRVSLEARGSRSLNEDCVDATARAAFVAKMVAHAPTKIWLAIGTNDYGLDKWSAANFGTAYAALLDDLHTALPSAVIYCQTPLLRTTETANTFGSTLGDYRTQIATAVSTRTAYATLVDGTAILTTGDLSDGIHPTNAGHTLYANYVISLLGL